MAAEISYGPREGVEPQPVGTATVAIFRIRPVATAAAVGENAFDVA